MNLRFACKLFSYTRQAFYKPRVDKKEDTLHLQMVLLKAAKEERTACPGKGCRAIYEQIGGQLSIGRDKAEQMMYELDLKLPKKRKYIRTTYSGTRPFENLLVHKTVTGINQVWQSDMTYFLRDRKVFYLIFITDVYSQKIVGHGAFERAFASNFTQVLKQAITSRKRLGMSLNGLIHHSDGGKQYESSEYKKVCQKEGIRQSMSLYSWENPYAERTNGLIKTRYLEFWSPRSLNLVKILVQKAVSHHNTYQKKTALGRLTPNEFEKKIINMTNQEKSYVLSLKPSQPHMKKNILNFV